jgi:uncharacterized repeat protein (TIGR03803 family)
MKLPYLALLIGCTFAAPSLLRAQPVETVLHTFSYFQNGIAPCGAMIIDSASNLYGTTYGGGKFNLGAVFEREPSGVYKVLYSFQGGSDGSSPYAGVVRDNAGNLYGTTYEGGIANVGVVYKLTPEGQETILHTFTGGADGAYPYAGITLDAAGDLYGTTYGGGLSNVGVVYKLTAAGRETILHTFTGKTDGGNPYAGLTLDRAGNLYGTASTGGLNYDGVVYRVSKTGNLAPIYAFSPAGGAPHGGVILDANGNLYGADFYGVYKISSSGKYTLLAALSPFTTGGMPTATVTMDAAGNLYGTTDVLSNPQQSPTPNGAVFKVDTANNLTLLYSFPTPGRSCPLNNGNPGVVLDAAGNVYGDSGDTGLEGAIYEVNSAGTETTLYSFPPAPGGSYLYGGVIRDLRGNLYGTTGGGGQEDTGVLYKLGATGETVLPQVAPVVGRSVTEDREGNLYLTGSSIFNAPGSIYKLAPSGQITVLYSFTGGSDGNGSDGVYLDAAGNLYGTSNGGGAPNGCVFKLAPSGEFTVLYSFQGGSDGSDLNYELTIDRAGNVYGTTSYGGAGAGVVYRISPAGQQTVLHSFSGGDGDIPAGAVILDPEGNLYGTTSLGGASNEGVIYQLSRAGGLNVLYNFSQGATGFGPTSGVTRDSEGNLYGTTTGGGDVTCSPFFGDPVPTGCGVVYELTPSQIYTVLHAFIGGSDGASPNAGVILNPEGNLYGTTTFGGIADAGVVFRIAR